ncbi:hypothetical protein F3Y22_tig00110234pilonHSYRG00153 [Hibiscus syriacus]|uniref:Uncharacterized protein n=1 Tax=Hibiscus syriacus TaxID=106335 RepID=A0A6A3B7E1_HIBSY|nr:hypothetical protein F3Y22_tig00110234pilonHSYRG00153 [Hibiscus syriacus]
MDDDNSNALRRMSTRTRKVDPNMAAALGSADRGRKGRLARLEALENDNVGIETVEMNDDDEASLDEDDQGKPESLPPHVPSYLRTSKLYFPPAFLQRLWL